MGKQSVTDSESAQTIENIEEENNNKLPFNLLAFLRRSQEWLEISGYHVGDIHSEDKPILITTGTTVVGDIFAPQVSVAGLLCGSVVANQIAIEKTGQIWGDLFTQKLQLQPGGKVQGWVSTVDDDTLSVMLQDKNLSTESNTLESPQLPESQNGSPLPMNRSELELTTYHQLQTEIAAAKAARAELEQSFEARLGEVAGGSSKKIASLSDEVTTIKTELADTHTALKETTETVQQRDAQIERQQNEIELSRNLIQEQSEKLEDLQQHKSKLSQQLDQLQVRKEQLDETLQEKVKQLEQQADRIHSIETAMQGSLQYSSDLEESLVRWQELAEVNEKRVEEIEQEVANKNFQIEENNKLVEMLKQQKQQIEEEWQLLHAELESIRKNPTRPLDDTDTSQINEEVFAAASAQVTQLEAELENLAQERAEQILWYRASLESNMSELETMRHQVSVLEEEIAALQGRVVELEEEVEKRETAVSDLKATFKEKRQEWLDWQQSARDEVTSLRDDLKQKENQVAASEDDLNFHLQEIQKQGNRLAEAQALLAERELQLRKARAMVHKQNQAIKDLRNKTEAYIKKLQDKMQ
ncbi:MAG: hypothetical protein DWQ04_01000 [Chloroflexi bacterium]|nr:MAG: hypothetical protein DWQ04_01000 [Chloroflexota bacterium]